MSSRKKLARERLEKQRKRQRALLIAGASVLACAVALFIVWVATSPPPAAAIGTASVAPDLNGDVRVSADSLRDGLNFVDYGGAEELIFFKGADGAVQTAFDTCEECYDNGDVHFSLNSRTLTCNVCGTQQPASVLGEDSWGGCKPVSITPEMRSDADTDIAIPAAVLSYADEMFSRWDAADFGFTFAAYADGGAEQPLPSELPLPSE
ncbi:MAG: DUF2318 domain-containing protein [Clostridiales bacterium]|jgi:uncharacterized membrane protein|nr:DUF2318 domain-containing protein [Clostridiales bacterium]